MYPKITVVTPSYNQGQYLEETILSVLNQKYSNLEYIIIDGGSTDNSKQIIDKYKSKLHYWVSEKDAGQTDAIWKGLQKASGELFNWINSDDLLSENALQIIADAYVSNNSPDLICADIIRFNNNRKTPHYRTNYWNNIARTLGTCQMCQPGMFYKTEIVRKLGLNTNLHYSMDVDLYFRYNLFLNKSRTAYVNTPVALFREHKNSKSIIETSSKEVTKFELEEKNIFYYYASLTNNDKILKKAHSIIGNNRADKGMVSDKRIVVNTKLFVNSLDYLAYKILLKYLYEFNVHEIVKYSLLINWFKIESELRRKAVRIFLKHIKLKIGFKQ